MAERGRKFPPERKALLDSLVADGWPIRQMVATHGFNFSTIKKHYPEYTGMTQSEAGKIGTAMKKINHQYSGQRLSA